jgi:CheY-like chemotaxis protein
VASKQKKILIYSKLIEKHSWIAPLLKKHKLTLISVENGSEALEKIDNELPVFAILDVGIPIISGIECVQNIKQSFQFVKTILISSVNSLSLQDTAKAAGVDLFVVDTIANVKVPEFINASLAQKELPPDFSEEIEREVLSRRGTPRFPYEGEVQFEINEQWHSGLFVNVSQDGILFQTQTSVGVGTNLVLSWMDQGLKHIEVATIVVRQIPSNHPQYPHLIGVQFLKASQKVDRKVAELSHAIDDFSESAGIELDLDFMEDLLTKDPTFFQSVFQGGKAPIFMEISMTDIVEYERNSFQNEDEYSRCIQKLVTTKIICQQMERLLDQFRISKISMKEYAPKIIDLMISLLDQIAHVEERSDELVKKTIEQGLVNERHQINESNNRLFQSKGSLLKMFSQRVRQIDVGKEQQQNFEEILQRNKQLTSYQKHFEEIMKQEVEQVRSFSAYKNPTKGSDKGSSKKKTKMTLEVNSEKKATMLPYFAALLVLVALFPFIEEKMLLSFAKDDFNLAIKPDKVTRMEHKGLLMNISKDAWDQIGPKGQELVLDQVEVYLTRKKLHQCKIVDGDQVIAAVYSTMSKDRKAFLSKIYAKPKL